MNTEQAFLDAADVDRLMGVVFALAAEVSILRDRMAALEASLVTREVIALDAIESFRPDPGLAARLESERILYVESVLGPVRGRAGMEDIAP